MDIVATAQVASSVGTFVLAALAYAQVREMKQARAEQEKSRLAQEKPQIIVDADYSRRGLIDIVVRNTGKGAAKNVRFHFSKPIPTRIGIPSNQSSADLADEPIFRDGLDYLAAGSEIRMIWDGSVGFWDFLKQEGLADGIRVTSTFLSLNEEADSTDWLINPLRLSRVPENGKGLNELVVVAEKILKAM